MSARDRYHDAVKNALLKEQWTITHDPLRLKFEDEDEIRIDLGAEHLLAAEKGTQKIAVEIKSFLSESALFDYHAALGQFLNYRLVLEALEPDRVLYLAVPQIAYETFFQRSIAIASVQKYAVKLLVYDAVAGVIVRWSD
ncbi:XisH family protein [Leptolyngbya sp. NIES-2104]|uniref:XisH family protein n=1 Tax=Leptolyngbya sp. NIES-2104 TaxID=1552121 RepID=UPI0006EC83BA|nr:XisH family protein [Leptolyngbya sp. NIES-2104]GAP93614.1 fdxN element excision controlling factor protein [Leptolyngbya sp. NIES-2104]